MTEYRSRILAIDDTPSNLQTLGAALAGEFELQIATSGEVGISLAFRFSPDLILLDIMMPGLDGFEVCRRLKASDQLKDIPVVFVTALREIESESDGLMMGAADYITKPFNVGIVRQRIRNLLERERLRKDVQDQQRMLVARVEELENTQSKLLLVSDALHKSDAFNLAVLNSLPDHIAVVDQSGNICEVNDAWRQFAQENGGNSSLTGSRVDIGTNYLEVCRTAVDSTSSDMTEILRGIEGVLSGQLKIFSAEYAYHSPTQQRWFVMNVTPLGDTTGAVIAHSDVTERTVAVHRMERMLLEQTAILDNEIIGIVKVKNRIILWANSAFEHMLGYGHGELTGTPTRQNYLNQKAYLDFGRAAYLTLAKDQVFRAPIEHLKKDGSRIWVSLSGAMLNSETGESLWAFVDITEQRINEERLAASELRLRTIIEADPECIKTIDDQGRLKQINPAGLALIEAESVDQVKGLMVEGLISADHRNAFRHLHQQVISGTSGQLTFEIVGLKGGHRWLETYAVPVREEGQTVFLAITRDVTERRKYDQQIQLAASVFASAREGVTITSSDGTIVDVNAAFTRITGYTREEVLGKNPRILNSGRQAPEFYAQLWSQVLSQGHWSGELWNRRKSGEIYAEFLTITAVRDSEGLNQHFVGLFSDITSVKLQQEELKHIAHYDALTGLANRVLLADRMSQSMLQANRRNLQLAVVFLDLDGFKAVNDKHGHLAGDNLLIALANGMKNTLRECDTLARIGGDEFVAVLGDLTERSDVIPMLERLIAVTSTPVLFGDKVLQVSGSLGVTYYPQSSDIDADQLLRQADQAMYKAKISGKNQYSFFDAEMDDGIREVVRRF